MDISKHLLLEDASSGPARLVFDSASYKTYRDRRLERMWKVLAAAVNPEAPETWAA